MSAGGLRRRATTRSSTPSPAATWPSSPPARAAAPAPGPRRTAPRSRAGAAGEGGGPGAGAAPVVARVAGELGAVGVGSLAQAFKAKGLGRRSQAQGGVEDLGGAWVAPTVAPNARLLEVVGKPTSMLDA